MSTETVENDDSKTTLGFWLYLMSDCIIFATLFATYAVLVNGIAEGPSGKDIFKLPFVLIETLLLLLSSFTFSIATLSMHSKQQTPLIYWLIITFFLGLSFIVMEFYEFNQLINEGFTPNRSAFLSSFFTLVGTHGLHVTVGLLWIIVMTIQIKRKGITTKNSTRLVCLGLFWHFLDIIWICVFSFVYLLGVL